MDYILHKYECKVVLTYNCSKLYYKFLIEFTHRHMVGQLITSGHTLKGTISLFSSTILKVRAHALWAYCMYPVTLTNQKNDKWLVQLNFLTIIITCILLRKIFKGNPLGNILSRSVFKRNYTKTQYWILTDINSIGTSTYLKAEKATDLLTHALT